MTFRLEDARSHSLYVKALGFLSSERFPTNEKNDTKKKAATGWERWFGGWEDMGVYGTDILMDEERVKSCVNLFEILSPRVERIGSRDLIYSFFDVSKICSFLSASSSLCSRYCVCLGRVPFVECVHAGVRGGWVYSSARRVRREGRVPRGKPFPMISDFDYISASALSI